MLTGVWQLRDAVDEATNWLNEYSATAMAEDFNEQREKLSSVAHPITSKLYQGSGTGGGGNSEGDEAADLRDEL